MNGWKKIEGMQFSVNVVGDTIFLLTDDINLNMIIESTGSWVAICRAILDGTKYEVVKKETAQQPSDISLLTARVEALEAKWDERERQIADIGIQLEQDHKDDKEFLDTVCLFSGGKDD